MGQTEAKQAPSWGVIWEKTAGLQGTDSRRRLGKGDKKRDAELRTNLSHTVDAEPTIPVVRKAPEFWMGVPLRGDWLAGEQTEEGKTQGLFPG